MEGENKKEKKMTPEKVYILRMNGNQYELTGFYDLYLKLTEEDWVTCKISKLEKTVTENKEGKDER